MELVKHIAFPLLVLAVCGAAQQSKTQSIETIAKAKVDALLKSSAFVIANADKAIEKASSRSTGPGKFFLTTTKVLQIWYFILTPFRSYFIHRMK